MRQKDIQHISSMDIDLYNERDSQGKTQYYRVTLSAMTHSFASCRDQNPIDGEVVYFGVIQDIIDNYYWGFLSVVSFKCEWLHNEVDEYGLIGYTSISYAVLKIHLY